MKIQLAEPMNFIGITEVWGEGFLKGTEMTQRQLYPPMPI